MCHYRINTQCTLESTCFSTHCSPDSSTSTTSYDSATAEAAEAPFSLNMGWQNALAAQKAKHVLLTCWSEFKE